VREGVKIISLISTGWFNNQKNNEFMQVFYVRDISGNFCCLDESESRHCIRVLRLKTGAEVKMIDGKGNLYHGRIADADTKRCVIEVVSVINDFEKRDYRLHIAISPVKNPDRFEWFIEKSVEIGTDEITPLICARTEKPGIKPDRLNSLIISAMKQSLKAKDTVLNNAIAFNDFIRVSRKGTLMIAHCNNAREKKGIADICRKGDDVVILIGPEGDFTEDEVAAAVKNGYCPVHLGRSRLRTETAGIAACHSVYFINQ
jgi:16S rRNA (uracil1498-N3)-methyltransferase